MHARAYVALAGLAETAPATAAAIVVLMPAGKVARDARAALIPTGSARSGAVSSDPAPPDRSPGPLGDWRAGAPLEYFGMLRAGLTEETRLVWGLPVVRARRALSGYACQFDECSTPSTGCAGTLCEATDDPDDHVDYDDPEVRAWTAWLDALIAVARERGAPPGESLLDDWITINGWTIMLLIACGC